MAKADLHLNLLMPGLFTSPVDETTEESSRITELKILLARSEREVYPENLHALLFDLFGVASKAGQNLPVAPVTYALDSYAASEGYWLRADPVYMRADGDRVMMIGNDCLEITGQEAAAISNELNPLFHTYGWQLNTPEPKRWYLHLPDDTGIFWHALSDMRGHDIHQYLPIDTLGGTNARLWRRVLNEAQMILHNSPVNHQREARGELPVNSLWFWGGGTLPQIPPGNFVQVWSNNALSLGLAKLSATPPTPAPATGTNWLAQVITPGKHLVVIEPVSNFTTHGESADMTTWKNNIESLNRDWFSPLLSALKSRQLASLHLYAGNGMVFHATPASVARWWKRSRSLAFYNAQPENIFNDFSESSAPLPEA